MLLTSPANPVKFRSRFVPAVSVRRYVPVVKLKLMELASLSEPDDTVMFDKPEVDTFTTGIPVTVRLVIVPVFHIVVVSPVMVILPVPKAIVRVVELLLRKMPVVSV